MSTLASIFRKWSDISLVLRILVGLGPRFRTVILLYLVSTLAAAFVAVGFIIGVVQDSVETALNSSGDVFFAVTAELRDRKKNRAGTENG